MHPKPLSPKHSTLNSQPPALSPKPSTLNPLTLNQPPEAGRISVER